VESGNPRSETRNPKEIQRPKSEVTRPECARPRRSRLKVIETDEEVAQMIERDHLAECAKYNPDGTLKSES